MTNDYISREAAIKSTWMILEGMGYPRGKNRSLERTVESVFKSAPAADVVEVVRCRDCEWWGHAGCAIRIVDDTDKPRENDFCSFGERKDGGRDDV